jgi:hypothetical protein
MPILPALVLLDRHLNGITELALHNLDASLLAFCI